MSGVRVLPAPGRSRPLQRSGRAGCSTQPSHESVTFGVSFRGARAYRYILTDDETGQYRGTSTKDGIRDSVRAEKTASLTVIL